MADNDRNDADGHSELDTRLDRSIPDDGDGQLTVTMQTQDAMFSESRGSRYRRLKTQPLTPGKSIGRYMVGECIGEGGMGSVYVAEDMRLQRRVALKVLRPDKVRDTSSHRCIRMIREALALAQISHPNIVQVYDAGVSGTEVFIAMEFIDGVTLTRWLRDRRRTWREVAEIFSEAASGLVAAHEAGLVHRDFKPDNVIVGDGRVRILDFGLAALSDRDDDAPDDTLARERSSALLDESRDSWTSSLGDSVADGVPRALDTLEQSNPLSARITIPGAVMGTPAYMAPEQHLGEPVDAKTDQYCFCVALYEGIYGRLPFGKGKRGGLGALKNQKLRGDTAPVPDDHDAPAWLHRAIVRGLSPSPADRWPDMAALRAVLGKHREVKRRRWPMWAGVAAMVLAAAIGVALFVTRPTQKCASGPEHLIGVWDAERRLATERAILATGVAYASDTWKRLAERLDRHAKNWVGMYAQTCKAHLRGEISDHQLDLAMSCLRRRNGKLGALVDVFSAADATVVENAVQAASGLGGLDDCNDTETLLTEVPPPDDPDTAQAVQLLRARLARIHADRASGAYKPALERTTELVSQAETLEYLPLESEVFLHQGLVYDDLGQYESASEAFAQAYWKALESRHMSVAAQAAVGTIKADARRAKFDRARAWEPHAGALLRRADAELDTRRLYHIAVGMVARKQGEYDEAAAQLTNALAISDALFDGDHVGIAEVLNHLGILSDQQGKPDAARKHLSRALGIYRRTLGPRHPQVGATLNNLGVMLLGHGKYDDAIAHLTDAIDIHAANLGADDPKLADPLNNLGIAFMHKRQLDQAEAHYQRALALYEAGYGSDHPRSVGPLNGLGEVMVLRGEYEQGAALFQRGLGIIEKKLGNRHPHVSVLKTNLAGVLFKQKNYPDATATYQRALDIAEAALGDGHPLAAYPLTGLGEVALAQNRPQRALPLLERALAIRTDKPTSGADRADTRFALARALWATGERTRAMKQARAAASDIRSTGAPDAKDLAEIDAWLREHERQPVTPP